MLDEEQLVAGLKQRREDAVRLYLERYRSLFQHCISHFESDPVQREDLFQELTWHALDRLERDSFDPTRGSFGTWLYRVAWCRCVDLKRKQNARRRVRMTPVGDDLPEEVDPSPGPGEAAGAGEIGVLVREALGRLDDQDRALLELRHAEGLTLPDVAARLEITTEQAKYRLRRATAELRRALMQRLPRGEAVE